MNDDQIVTLLRDTPLPADPPDRYTAVTSRGRRADKRRTTVLAAVVTVVAVTGTASALTWRGRAKAGPESFLTTTTEARTARITMDMPGAEHGSARGVIDFRSNAFELEFAQGSQRATMRGIGKDVWVAGPLATGATHWVHFPSSNAMRPGIAIFNPGDALEELRKEHAQVAKVGSARVNGVDVTDYRVIVPADHKGTDVNAVAVSNDQGHLFVDRDGLVRRISSDDGTFRIDFTDFGIPVDIRPPAKNDVTEFDSTAFSAGSSTGDSGTLTGPSGMTPEQKRQACAVVRSSASTDTQLTEAQKEQILKVVCG